jgi:SAM-dependent methyltransferase
LAYDPPKNRSNPLRIRTTLRAIEDWWFDTTRSIETCIHLPHPERDQIVGELRDSLTYSPVRANNVRSSLRDLPIHNYSDYTFIDIGSGKGRVLFVAAEFPFRHVLGVEFATPIHQHAVANIQRFSHWRQKCPSIESINANAMEYEFPNENLILYLCNPFGPEVLQQMLANLEESFRANPRSIILILLWPERAQQVAKTAYMQPYRQTRRYHIYQMIQDPPPRTLS